MAHFRTREKSSYEIDSGFMSSCLRAVSSAQKRLKAEHLEDLYPYLWKRLGKAKYSWESEAAFLFLICAEIIPDTIRTLIKGELQR